MANTELKVRLQLKYDSLTNWETVNPILKAGEVAIAYNLDGQLTMKIGDGTKAYNQLPQLTAEANDVYDWAKALNKPVYAANEIVGLGTAAVKNVSDFDAAGAAEAVQGTTTATVKDLEDSKLDSVTAGNNGITIGGTALEPTVGVKLSTEKGNILSIKSTSGQEGLYASISEETDYTVTVTESAGSDPVAKVYTLKQRGVTIGTINIPKDLVISSGSVVKDPAGQPDGTYLVLVLNNTEQTKIYINVSDLIEYVTSGSQIGDMVFITVSNDHKVTATLTDGTVTKAKLVSAVQTSLDKADLALQASDITTGTANGTIAVKGSDVAIKGLADIALSGDAADLTQTSGDYLILNCGTASTVI